MHFVGRLLIMFAWIVDRAFVIMYYVLIVRIIISWVNADPYNQIVQIVSSIADPVLRPFRRLPLQFGGIDFSPILAFLALAILRELLVNQILVSLARQLL